MTKKQELAKLKEFARVYQNPNERVAACNRRKWILLGIAWFMIFIATLLLKFQAVSDVVSMVIAVVAGCVLGIASWFSAAANQIPLLVRYTALREEEIRKRIDELSAN
jgi:hypothetical protein